MYLHRFYAHREKPSRGAEPRVEPGPALQQAGDAVPTDLRRTLFYQDLIWRGVQVHSDDFKKLNEFAESAWVCRDPGNADSIKETRRRLLAQVKLSKCALCAHFAGLEGCCYIT